MRRDIRSPLGDQAFPADAAGFTALGIAAPTHIWLCDEASGNLVDEIAAGTLTATGTPAATYQEVAAYFPDEFGVGFPGSGNPRFDDGSSLLAPGLNTSASYLAVVEPDAAADGNYFYWAGSNGRIQQLSNGPLLLNNGGTVSQGGGFDYRSGSPSFPILVAVDDVLNTCKVFTHREEILSSASPPNPLTGAGGIGTQTTAAAEAKVIYFAAWIGTALTKVDLAKFWALGLEY